MSQKKPTRKQLKKLRRVVGVIAGKPLEQWIVMRGFPRKAKFTVH